MQGITFHVFSANDIATGSNLLFTLAGQPQQAVAAAASSNSTTNLIIGGSVLLISLLLTGWWLIRAGVFKGGKLRTAKPAPVILEDPDAIIDAILTLDDLHKEGALPDTAYQTRRAELKERLRNSYQSLKPSGQSQ
jgi:hypothetical protein